MDKAFVGEWAERLHTLLHGRFAAAELFCMEEVGSTNEFLKEKARDLPGEAVVLALSQTAGVGRRGHTFRTVPGEALHLSFLLRGQTSAAAPVSLTVGVAVRQALYSLCGAGFSLKWPNDVLAAGKKVCGILCETVPDGIICGIGVNLLSSPQFFEKQGLSHAVSVQMVKGSAPAAEALAAEIANVLETVLAADANTVLRLYAAHCSTLGAPVRVLGVSGEAAEGIADSITPQGELVVRTGAGRVTVRAGDVSVRGVNGYS